MKIKIGKTRYQFVDIMFFFNKLKLGEVNYDKKTIAVSRVDTRRRQRSDKQRQKTLWHECVHAILEDMGSPKEKDEVFVTELAKRIQQVGAQIGF